MAFIELHIHAEMDPALLEEMKAMTAALDRLTASVAANQSATDSVLQLVSTLSQEIRDNIGDDDALTALADKLDAENANIANAVTSNTPAAPGATAGTPAAGTTTTTTGTGGDAIAGAPSTTTTAAAPGSTVVGEVPPAPAEGQPAPASDPDPVIDGA